MRAGETPASSRHTRTGEALARGEARPDEERVREERGGDARLGPETCEAEGFASRR